MKFPFGGGQRRKKELNDEIPSHLQMATRDRVERGESSAKPDARARRELGNADLVKDVTRDNGPGRGWKISGRICGTPRACYEGIRGSRRSRC